MDGWETRRRRTPGYDWADRSARPARRRARRRDRHELLHRQLSAARASIEACDVAGTPSAGRADVRGDAVASAAARRSTCTATRQNEFAVDDDARGHAPAAEHLSRRRRGAAARARRRRAGRARVAPVATSISPRWRTAASSSSCSDMYYGHRQNLILPGRSTHMGDGWETKRRRGPGHDWTIVRLARRGTIERVELDTDHYKGNAPGRCMVEACDVAPLAVRARARGVATARRRDAVAAAHASRLRRRRVRRRDACAPQHLSRWRRRASPPDWSGSPYGDASARRPERDVARVRGRCAPRVLRRERAGSSAMVARRPFASIDAVARRRRRSLGVARPGRLARSILASSAHR